MVRFDGQTLACLAGVNKEGGGGGGGEKWEKNSHTQGLASTRAHNVAIQHPFSAIETCANQGHSSNKQ